MFLRFVVCLVVLGACLPVPSSGAAAKITLEEALTAGSQRSESLLQGREQMVQLEARQAQIKGGIFPQVTFNLQHQIQQAPSDPAAIGFSPQHQTTANFQAVQPIFRGLREWKALSQSEYLHEAQEASQEEKLLRLYRDIATRYFQVLSLEQDLKNLSEQAEIYDRRVKDLSGRVRRGESNQTDYVTAESTQASLLAEIRLIQGDLETGRENLHFLTGLDRAAELVDPNREPGVRPLEEYLANLEKRPDVREAQKKYDAADKGVGIAWGAHLPSVDAVGNYYLTRPGFLADVKWDVGVRLVVPLFEGGSTAAKVSEATSQRKEAELELARVKRAAIQEIRSLHNRLAARLDQVKNLKKSAELSRKNSSLLEKDYRRGLARNIDVQLALTEFRVAQRSFDQAHFASQLDLFHLQAASAQVQPK